ncbi:MAG: mannose-1-phosphate guanylyltransferase/mannose-6-phosphate isomerase [Nitrospinaceae bacterium]
MHGIILAGGKGTRFWPRSREQAPKQLLKIAGPGTLVQNTLERLLPLIPVENILLVTNALHAFETCNQLSRFGFSPAQLIAEPVGRNTAAAIGLAARILYEKNPDAVIGVFPADHVITDPEKFRRVLQKGEAAAARDYLVTLGIQPTRPETGYGYIQQGPPLEGMKDAFQVKKFVEKPDESTAEKFLREGGYFWNCGVFLWKAGTFLEELKTHIPILHERLEQIVSHIHENPGRINYRVLDDQGQRLFESLPSLSVDYGVLEKSRRVALIPTEVGWSDVGSWNALVDVLGKEADGNVFSENVLSLDCSGSIIQGDDRIIAALGLKDTIVVDTPDALLVCARNRAQDVKKVVDRLEKNNRPEAKIGTTVNKPWGSYTVLEKKENYLVKRINVQGGEKLSLQSHGHRTEHWTVVSGLAEVRLDGKMFVLKQGESIFIPKKSKHRLGNPNDTPLTLIEVQLGDHLDENDITRYDDNYGRC